MRPPKALPGEGKPSSRAGPHGSAIFPAAIMDYIYLLVGFVILIVGADKLVEGASSLAKNLKVPTIVIGLTVVAFGTSAPELAVNVFSSLEGNSDLVMGNVVGSNIFNVCGILGITSIIGALSVKNNTTWLEVPFSALSALVVAVMGMDMLLDGAGASVVSRSEGWVLLGFFAIFLTYNISLAINGKEEGEMDVKTFSNGLSALFVVIGLVGLVLGGKLIVSGATGIAHGLGIPDRIIGLTVVSIGTSLPELATSVAAVRKQQVDIAVGNVVGSNIFNVFFILGISATLNPIAVSESTYVDFGLNIFASVLLFAFLFLGKGRRIERWEGFVFVAIYLAYTAFLVRQAMV
jgi:cation:H+ antiporter